ncbi:MAG: type I pullulanase [Acholeplasmatales bacterium]|nr:type I pullulanase [Acholeplasmatales bacterium]
MQDKIQAFIDSYESITILVNKSINNPNKRFYISDMGNKTELEILASYEEYAFYKYIARFIPSIQLYKEYIVSDEDNNSTILRSGSIIRTPQFEYLFRYDGPLGVEYTKEKSIFRIWSPVAKEIILELHNNGKIEKINLYYTDNGVWQIDVEKDLEGYGYIYYVRTFDKLVKINDPYAISSSSNGELNYVIDINKLYKMTNKKPYFSGKYTDSIIYEASIRDFTVDLNNEKKGTFLGLLENNPTKNNIPTGLEYIKELGITHLQLLPTYDFGGVDDEKKNKSYNWGYNPEQYFIPCGWYSMNPNDPYSRINELLKLIDKAHEMGIRIVMDVVFNHVYKYELFAFDHLVPGYFFRVEADGRLSNATGCGNVIATERYMASRFVIDVLKFYAKIYNVSGFRFDLMGLLDIDTLNNAYEELNKIDNTIMLYGEGWNMMNPLPDEKRPHMFNHMKIPNYAFFNDRYRDFVRGSQWNKTPGYAFGDGKSLYDLHQLLLGSCIDYFKFNQPTQSINYVECHDNYTMYDYGRYSLEREQFDSFEACKLAIQIILVSQGIPFIHAGQEFFRTKMGIENSYNANDSINRIDYERRDKHINVIESIKDLISIRKSYDVFRLSTKDEILNRIHNLDGITGNNITGILLEDKDFNLIVVIKNNKSLNIINLDNTKMIYDGSRKCDINNDRFVLSEPGIYIFRKEKNHGIRW